MSIKLFINEKETEILTENFIFILLSHWTTLMQIMLNITLIIIYSTENY